VLLHYWVVRVLVVEDQAELADDIADGLRDQGIGADTAYDGATGVEKALMTAYDVIILDRDLPRVHGDAVCATLTGTASQARILMLTAATTVSDRVDGLNLGADDYLTKPFAFAELVARVRALGRRAPAAWPLTIRGELVFDRARRRASRAGRPLSLTRKELAVLEELLELEGHRVETATSGKAAVERFQRGERYDLVLCDVGMPQMSGWQVVREIRRIAPAARIWLLTGWANEISEHDPRLADVQGVLGKPLDLDQLRSLLGDPQGPTPDLHHATA